MPLFEYECAAGHRSERYFVLTAEAPAEYPCRTCGGLARRCFPLVNCLQYYSEATGRVSRNLAPGQVIHSYGEEARLLKARGLEYASQWHASAFKQTDGLLTRAQRAAKEEGR